MCAAILTAALEAVFVETLAAVLFPELVAAVSADLAVGIIVAWRGVECRGPCRDVPRALPRRRARVAVSLVVGLATVTPAATCCSMYLDKPQHTATCRDTSHDMTQNKLKKVHSFPLGALTRADKY